ncbi:protein kinase [Streptosporangium sp. NBC_01495]|uniref:serine/threonine-protein kinase n=1 Tax=Streptosporangium sp. NBC_01495 TaxID=2903899 RepID=UPI002E31FC0A|nr:protein kinase [Streptosporangium sp. NBC_01495]
MTDSQGIIGARYRLLERIGRGGMGTVWRARDEVLGREVAVKEVIPSPDLTGPEREVFTVRTLREARAAGRIGHPGVATVYDVIEEYGRPWIVMQLVDSRTLGAVIREDGPLPPMRVARIGLEVLGALLAAHQAGVLHRDVKPDNVLLAKDGRAVLTDFGIAVLEGDSSITRTGSLIGTPAFIAPERASGGPAEFASDLWSLGVTLHVAVEGRSPFERAHPLATLSAVMHQEPSPMRFAGPLAPVIFGLLHKDPARRMSAREVQIQLTSLVNGTAPQPTMPIELPVEPPVGTRTGPSTAIPVVAAVPGPDGAPTTPAGAMPPMPSELPEPEPVPAFAPRRRRRPATAALVATALAIAATAGGMAWVAVNSSPQAPQDPPASSSVAPDEKKPSKEPEQAKVPARDNGGGTSGRQAPERSGNGDPAPRDRPSGKPTGEPSEKPSGKPSQDPSAEPEEDPTEPGQDEEEGQGEGTDEGSGQDDAPGEGQQGDSPDQVDPNAGRAALETGTAGEAERAGATGAGGF